MALKKSSYRRIRAARACALSPLGAMQWMVTSVLSTAIGRYCLIWELNWSIRYTFGYRHRLRATLIAQSASVWPTRSSTPSRGVASLPGSVTSAAGAAGQGVGKAVAPVLGGVSKTVTKVKQIVGAVTGGGTSGQQGASPPSSLSPNNLQHLLSYLLGQ